MAGEMTASEAARTLADLPRYEETLTAKAFGITVMAFGIASAAIGLTYHIGTPWLVGLGMPWLLSFLWAPWILAAALLTATVWHTQSISLGTQGDGGTRESWWFVVGFSVLYMALWGVASLVRAQTAWDPAEGVMNLYVLAVFTAAIGMVFVWRYHAFALTRPLFGAALVILLAGFAGDAGGFTDAAATLYGATVTLVGYMGAGIAIARRG